MEPRNLADLLHKFCADPGIPANRKSMTRTASMHATKALDCASVDDVPVHRVIAARKALSTYLATTQLSARSCTNYQSFFNRFIVWCQDEHLLPRSLEKKLTPEWFDLTYPLKGVKSGRKGHRDALRKLAQWCSGYSIQPATLTTDDLKAYAEYMKNESGVMAWGQVYNRAAQEWKLHEAEGRVPPLIWHKLPSSSRSKYSLKLDEWPIPMQREYAAYRKWCLKSFSTKRNPRYKQREVSADQALSCMERAVGFAINIHGMEKTVLSMDLFFDEEIITAYFEWMINDRLGGKPTGTLERLAAQFIGMARGYFDRTKALEWLLPLKMQVSGAPKRNKRPLLIPMEQLEMIPKGIHSYRLEILDRAKKANRIASPMKQAQLVRAELVCSLLNRRPLRQKNLREIQIGRQLIEIEPNKYYLKFDGEEMKNGYPFEIPFPDDLVPLLEDYLTNYRITLNNGFANDFLFPAPHGTHICDRTVQTIVGRHAMRVLGKKLTPHLIRDCVAHWLTKQNPDNILMVSRLLGHRDIQTTINIYCNIEPTDAAEYYDDLRVKMNAKEKS